MHRIHELLASPSMNFADLKTLEASVRIDLGDLEDLRAFAKASPGTIYKLPAPIVSFQVQEHGNTHIFLAEERDDVTFFYFFSKTMLTGAWVRSKAVVGIDDQGAVFIAPDGENMVVANDYIRDYMGTPAASKWYCTASNSIMRAVEVLSCSNVELVQHQPPKFINKKRAAKGKVPFLSWHTIQIKCDASPGGSADEGGTHASPRLHFRRGHIRKLPNGSRTWVRACMVGDKALGFSGHDYVASPPRVGMSKRGGIQ